MFNNHLMKACLAAVFAIGLAACSSSSDTSSTTPDPEPTAEEQLMAQVTELQNQINALRTQLGLGEDDSLTDSISDLQDMVDDLQMQVDEAEEAEEMARQEAEKAAAAAMAATAAKLYAGLSAETATDTGADGNRFAQYVNTGDNMGDIQVSIDALDDVFLSEDEDAMVDDNHGWEGMKYTASPMDDGEYEAIVYSNVEEPTMGRKFGSATPGTGPDRGYEYTLNAMGILVAAEADGVDASDDAFVTARVASPSFDHTAGSKEFKLPDPNPDGVSRINIAGSYHGVDGTYTCTPGTGGTCTATVAAMGFTLGGAGTPVWTFMPSNANARVMSAMDPVYASYGWWIHKAENDGDFTASVFVTEVGDVAAASDLAALNGTATYSGGAAGKYALSSTTGGTNDAGHFTARATLEANFTDNMISGTIDYFMGADGESRDWSVELNETDLSATGVIDGLDADNEEVGTVWTIGDMEGDTGGQWRGALQNNDDSSGVPQVATGTFYSEFGRAGKMAGAFGATPQ